MTLYEIALKNLIRRKGKAAFVLAGLVIGVATVVAVISYVNATAEDINNKLERYGANILIFPNTDNLTLSYGGMTLGGVSFERQEIKQDDLAGIHNIKNAGNIAAVGPMVFGAVKTGNRSVLMAGVDFNVVRTLKPWWKIVGDTPGIRQIMLGNHTAHVLGIKSGDTIEINGRPMQVSGVLTPTGSQDDQLIFASLGTAQNILEKQGVVSMVEIAALCNACPVEEMVRQISEVLPGARVMAIQKVVKGRMDTLGQIKRFSFGIAAVVVLVGGMMVLVTLMGSIRERCREIGIFRAIGFRKRHIMRIIFIETGILSLFAGVFGYTTGILGTRLGIRLFGEDRTISVPTDPDLAVAAVGLAVFVGLIASAYPAFMAARMDPNDALKAI